MAKTLLLTTSIQLLVCVTTGQLALPKERTTGLECVPEGKTVSYECTVNDPTGNGSTVWLGSAFNCSDSEIVLSHSAYSGVGVSGVCAGLSAQSVSENGTEFTSTLTLTATAQLNGTTINCTLNGMVSFGWETIRVCSVSCDPRELGDNITHSNDSGTASVPNGVVVFNGTEMGSVARLICDDGFSPSGPVIRMCVSSGNWSGQSQSCGVVTNYSPWWIPLVACVGVAILVICYVLLMFMCCCRRRHRFQRRHDPECAPLSYPVQIYNAEQDTSPNFSSNSVHHQPTGIRREGGASYSQFVPGASEGEFFGEVHTQYAQSVSNDNSGPVSN